MGCCLPVESHGEGSFMKKCSVYTEQLNIFATRLGMVVHNYKPECCMEGLETPFFTAMV